MHLPGPALGQGVSSAPKPHLDRTPVPPTLQDLIDADRTAVITMEQQRGVVGDLASMPDLAAELQSSGVIPRTARLCAAARSAGAMVVHCTAVTRPDGAGRKNNNRLLAATAKTAHLIQEDSPGAEVLPELLSPTDLVLPRLHGLTPFTGTSLDQILRNSNINTIIATGSSVNVGVLGLVLSGSDLGYQVVVPTDAVAGVPKAYADAVLQNTIGLLATLTSTEDVVAAWES